METTNVEAMLQSRQPMSAATLVGSFGGRTVEVTYTGGATVRGIMVGMVEGFMLIQRLDGKRTLLFPGCVAAIADTTVQ